MSNWKSRKLWLSIVGAFVAFSNGMGWWGDVTMSTEQILLILTPLLAYVGVEGMRDVKEA